MIAHRKHDTVIFFNSHDGSTRTHPIYHCVNVSHLKRVLAAKEAAR